MSAVLTRADLEQITGRKHFSKMCEWLDQAGIPYRKRVDGKSVLTWHVFDQALLKGGTSKPDFDWFKKAV